MARVCGPSRASLAVVAFVFYALLLFVRGDPEQVQVGVHSRQKHTLVFFWATERRTERSCVKYGTISGKLINQDCQEDDKQFRHGYGRYDSPWLHEVEVYGFWSDKRFFYRVGDNSGGWSPEYSVVTRPKDHDGEVRFIAVGDQDLTRNAYRVMDAMVDMNKKRDYHFLLQLGDLSYADGKLEDWDEYGHMNEPLTSKVPGIFASGNHEDDSRGRSGGPGFDAYLARWRHGEGEDDKYWWSVHFGPLHIAVLSSDHDYDSGSKQREWLDSDLEEANKPENRLLRPWVVVAVHRPMYSSGAHGSDVPLRRAVEPLLEKHGVQIVLAGHDHNYERILPVIDGEVKSRDRGEPSRPYVSQPFSRNGVGMEPIHLVLGTGGRGTRDCRDRSWTASDDCHAVHGFSDITASRREIKFKFIERSGNTVDEFRMCSQSNCAEPPPIPSDDSDSSRPTWSWTGQGAGSWQQRQKPWAKKPWSKKPWASARVASANAVEAVVADYFQYQDPESYLVNSSLLQEGFRPDARNATAYQLSFMMSFPSVDFGMFEENEGLLDRFVADYREELAAAAGILVEQVTLLSITPGSVLVDTMLTYLLEEGSRSGTVDDSLDRVQLLSRSGLCRNATFLEMYGPSVIEPGSLMVNLARPYEDMIIPEQQQPRAGASLQEQYSTPADAALKDHASVRHEENVGGKGLLVTVCLAVLAVPVVGLVAWAVARHTNCLHRGGCTDGEGLGKPDLESLSTSGASNGPSRGAEPCTPSSDVAMRGGADSAADSNL